MRHVHLRQPGQGRQALCSREGRRNGRRFLGGRAGQLSAVMSTELASRLVNRLRVARAERELSQDRLARAAGVRVDKRFWLEGDGR